MSLSPHTTIVPSLVTKQFSLVSLKPTSPNENECKVEPRLSVITPNKLRSPFSVSVAAPEKTRFPLGNLLTPVNQELKVDVVALGSVQL